MATDFRWLLSQIHCKTWMGVSAISNQNKCSKINPESLLLQHQATIIEGITESKAKYRKIVQAGIAKWVSDFQKGNIQVNSVDDLKKLIELDIELQRDEL
ncbi:hypothetical protein KIAC18_000282 [Sporomusa sphaeroides]|uniref:hypothetical protein n=1 Tax=Sporomusa sphaeroides TaxID=47679 RepID=UPI003DA16A8A